MSDSKIVHASHRVKMPKRYAVEAFWFIFFGVLPWIIVLFGFNPGWLVTLGFFTTGVAVALVLFQHVTGYLIRKNTTLKFRGDRETGKCEAWMSKPTAVWKKYFTVLENQINIHNLTGVGLQRYNNKPMLLLQDNNDVKTMVIAYRLAHVDAVKEFLISKTAANSALSEEDKRIVNAFCNAETEAEAASLEKTKRSL